MTKHKIAYQCNGTTVFGKRCKTFKFSASQEETYCKRHCAPSEVLTSDTNSSDSEPSYSTGSFKQVRRTPLEEKIDYYAEPEREPRGLSILEQRLVELARRNGITAEMVVYIQRQFESILDAATPSELLDNIDAESIGGQTSFLTRSPTGLCIHSCTIS